MPLIVMWALMLVILVAASANGAIKEEPNQSKSVDVVFKSSNLTPGLQLDLLAAGGNIVYSLVSNTTAGNSFRDEVAVVRGLYVAKIYNCSKEWSQSSIDVYFALSTSDDLLLLQTIYSGLENEVISVSLDLTIPIGENEEWYVHSSPVPESWYSSSITGWECQSVRTVLPIPGTALYLKRPFSLSDIESISSLVISVRHVSDCALYLNGHLLLENGLSETLSQTSSASSNETESFKQFSFPLTGLNSSPFLQETNWLAVALTAHSDTPFDCVVMTLRGNHVMRLGDHGYFADNSDIDILSSLSPVSVAMDNLTIGVTFPEERHEWVSSVLLDLRIPEESSFELSVQARSSVSDPWVSLAVYQLSWKPTTLYWIPLNTTAWWSQLRLTDFRSLSSSSPVLTLNRMVLVMDAPTLCDSLTFNDTSLMAYQSVTIKPSSMFFSEFSILPALPSGLTLDSQSGVIWGLPTEEVEQEYTIRARADRCNVTATLVLVIRPCEGDAAVVSAYLDVPLSVVRSVDGSFLYRSTIPDYSSSQLSICIPRGDYVVSYDLDFSPYYAAVAFHDTRILIAGGLVTDEENQLSFHVDPILSATTYWHILFTDSPDMNQSFSEEMVRVSQIGDFTHPYLFLQKDLFLSPLSSFSTISIQVDHVGGFAAYLNQMQVACMSCLEATDSTLRTSLFSILLPETLAVEGHNNLTFLFIRPQGYSGSPCIRVMANAFGSVTTSVLFSLESAVPELMNRPLSYPFASAVIVKEYGMCRWSVMNSLGIDFNTFRVYTKMTENSQFILSMDSANSTDSKWNLVTNVTKNMSVREVTRVPSRSMKHFVLMTFEGNALLYRVEFAYDIRHLLPAVPFYSTDPATPSWRTLADDTHWEVAQDGAIPSSSRVTTYVVARLNLLYVESYPQFLLSFYVNAGVILYVNGEEYIRFNMPSGPVTAETHATEVYSEPQKVLLGLLYPEHLVRGVNVFSFELHRFSEEDSPCSLNVLGDYVENGWRLDTLSEVTISPEQDQSTVDRILDGEIHSSLFIPDQCENVTITFDFGLFARVFVNEYKFAVGGRNNAHHPSGWAFYGSIDGVEWITLDTQTNQMFSRDYESRSFGFMDIQPFRWYRIQFTQCDNQPLPLQTLSSTGFEMAETYLFSALVGTCPVYHDSSSRLRSGETRVVQCASGFSGFVKTSCRDSVLTVEDHCVAIDLFQLSTPVLVLPYKRPFTVTPITPFFNSLVYTFSPPLPSSITLQGNDLSGSYNNLTTTLFTVTALYRHHFTSEQVLEIRVDTSPCRGVDGFNDTAHGEVGRLLACPNNTEGYLSRTCYSGQWEALEDHCTVVHPSLFFSPPSVTGRYGDFVQLELKSSPQRMTRFTLLNNLPSSLSLSETGVLSGVITETVSLEVSALIGEVSVTATASITLLPRDCGDTPEGSTVESECPNGKVGHVDFLCQSGELIQSNESCHDPPPTQFFYEESRIELVVGQPFRLPYPRVTPSNLTFAMKGNLPRGVYFEKETGVLYGVPQAETPLRSITISAFNGMGRIETTLVISVEGLHCDAMQGVEMASIGTTQSVPCERRKGYGSTVYTCKEVEGKGEWVMEEFCLLRANYWRDFYVEMTVALCCTMGIVIAVCAFLVFVRLLLSRSLKTLPRNTFNIEMLDRSVKPIQSKTKWSVCLVINRSADVEE